MIKRNPWNCYKKPFARIAAAVMCAAMLAQNGGYTVFAQAFDESGVLLENTVNIPTENLIASMHTGLIDAGNDFLSVLSPGGEISIYFRDYYANQAEAASDIADRSARPDEDAQHTAQTSGDDVSSAESDAAGQSGASSATPVVDLKTILRNAGVTEFNSFLDYADQAAAEKSMDEIRQTLLQFNNVIGVSCGNMSVCGQKNDGTVFDLDFSQGYLNESAAKEYGAADFSGKKVSQIVTANTYFAVLYEDGTVGVFIGEQSGYAKELKECSSWTGITALAAGKNHLVGLKTDGTLVSAGVNNYGQKDITGFSGVAAVSASANHTVILFNNGTVKAVGSNTSGQCDMSGFDNIVAVDTGENGTIGLKCNGTVVYAGPSDEIKRETAFWENIVAVKAGRNFVAGLTEDGTVVLSQGDKEHLISLGASVKINVNETKNLKDTRTKIKEAYDKNSSTSQSRLQQQIVSESNRHLRMGISLVLGVVFLATVIVYCFVLKKKNKRI